MLGPRHRRSIWNVWVCKDSSKLINKFIYLFIIKQHSALLCFKWAFQGKCDLKHNAGGCLIFSKNICKEAGGGGGFDLREYGIDTIEWLF